MLFVISFCVIVVLIGVLDSIGIFKRGLEFAFGLIILFSAIRYNFGADYMYYLEGFRMISNFPSFHYLFKHFDGPFDKYEGLELGWVVLNRLFCPLGFNVLIIFTSLVTNVIYFKFIKQFVPRKWYWLALFTYMFDTNLFFVPLSMMRQSLAMVLFVFSFRFISDKQPLKAIIILLFAATFHKSAIILIPFVFLGYLMKFNGIIVSTIYAILCVILLVSKNLTTDIVTSALSFSEFESYSSYFLKMEAADEFGLGFVSRLLTFFIPFLFYYADGSQRFNNRLTAFVAGGTFLIAPFTLIMGFLGRIDYYFAIFNIVAIPLIYNWIKKLPLRYGLLFLYMAYTLYSYNQFFKNPDWITFTHYQTIF